MRAQPEPIGAETARHDLDTPLPRGRRLRHVMLGDGPLVPLAIAHGLAAAGDAFVTVSLADSLFFNISPDASRRQVLIYLVVTMAPLAVLAPLVGPAVDRFRRSQRFVASLFYVLRALSCLAMVSFLLDVAFYPIALALLIASKASGVVKQTLVQSLVDDPDELVATNARLARFASITAIPAAAGAVLLLSISGPSMTLRAGTVMFAAAALVILKTRPRATLEIATDEVEYAETHLPVVLVGSIGIMAIRAAVGFFLFTLAFTLRSESQPAYIYGLAAACYGVGAFTGHTITGALRRYLREPQLIALAIAAPAAFTLVGVLGVSTPLLLLIAALVGLSTTMGRTAFDALLQHRAPEALLGRAGARYETRFQLAWVVGGAIATPITLAPEFSMMVLTGIYLPGLFVFERALREARHFEEAGPDPLAAARQRVVDARLAADLGEHRTAIVEASAAADLAQTVCGPYRDRSSRRLLDDLRRSAIDPTVVVAEAEAMRAIKLATHLLDSKPATIGGVISEIS